LPNVGPVADAELTRLGPIKTRIPATVIHVSIEVLE
jgi:hypothetical protein